MILIYNIELHIAPCSSGGVADCVAGATCIDSLDGRQFICLCPPGLVGDGKLSGTSCTADECSTVADCTDIASCVNSLDGFLCICPSGYKGDGRINSSSCMGELQMINCKSSLLEKSNAWCNCSLL